MMIGERGPEKKRHLPKYSGGCYRGRIDDCCWLCVSRVVTDHLLGFLRIGTKHATAQTHELIGNHVELPMVQREDGTECIEHVSGEITDVFDLDDEPSVFAVQLENGERLALSVKHLN
jgi:hypothetical protein